MLDSCDKYTSSLPPHYNQAVTGPFRPSGRGAQEGERVGNILLEEALYAKTKFD